MTQNGAAIAGNDNWQDDQNATDISKNGLAPTDAAESATLLHLPAGAYTAIVSGVDGGAGMGLAEFFDLESFVARARLSVVPKGTTSPVACLRWSQYSPLRHRHSHRLLLEPA